MKSTLKDELRKLTPAEFEQVLHPVFQEDELTLIVVGAVLGLAVGYGQLVWDQKGRGNAATEVAGASEVRGAVEAATNEAGSVVSWYDSGKRLR